MTQAKRDENRATTIIGVSSVDLATPTLVRVNPSTGALLTEISTFAISINEQTDSYTLVLTDAGKLIDMNKGSANTLTIPLYAVVAFPIGTRIAVRQLGTGQTTVAITATGTLQSYANAYDLAGQYAIAMLIKTATNTWALEGDLA